MHILNIILAVFIIAVFFVALAWAFNTVRQIELQKNFCAIQLTSIAKLWRKANFVPEDAKERESLYLYRDFLRKFDESECKYPIMVKNGKVRSMNRKEYDDLCGQKTLRPFSLLLLMISVIIAGVALVINIAITKQIYMGIGLALILPATQGVLWFFVNRFNQEKNAYRDGIFLALKENSKAFLTITKPFIVVDAYPEKFGKNAKPLYATVGQLTDEQLEETRAYIVRQKEAETAVVLKNVDNRAEIDRIEHPEAYQAATTDDDQPTDTPTDAVNPAAAEIAAQMAAVEAQEKANAETAAPTTNNEPVDVVFDPDTLPELTDEQKSILLKNLITDMIDADIGREVKKIQQAAAAAAVPTPTTPNDVPTDNPPTDAVPPAPTAPSPDDFSLDGIALALEAEINSKKKKS